MEKIRHRFPRIGMRIVKSALAVGICSLIYYYILGYEDIPFFFVIATMQCMQPYQSGIKDVAKRNIFGTLIGAFGGFVLIMLQYFILDPHQADFAWYCLLVALGTAGTLYTAVVLNCGDMAYFACVVFLCMIRVHISDEGPFIYVFRRLAETFVGIGLGTAINAMHLPRRKTKNTLFVASLDEILHSEISHLSDYSKVELNRILADGIPLSVISAYSVASFREAGASLMLKLPVILMDGAVIYDHERGLYPYKCEISRSEALELEEKLSSMGLDVLKTAIMDNSMLIFHGEINNPGAQAVYNRLRLSPYRNYLKMPLPEGVNAVCLHGVNSREKIDAVYHALLEQGYGERYRICVYDSLHAPGYAYLRIYHRDSTRQRAIEKLREITGFRQVKSFGNDPEIYDVCVSGGEGEGIIKTLKKEFEPFVWTTHRNA